MFAVIHKAGEALPDGLASVVAKLDNLAAGKPPSPAELEPFRSAASAKLQEEIQRANLTLGVNGSPSAPISGVSSAANASRLNMQLAAEQAAGTGAPTQITSYSSHALEQIAGRDGGIGVSHSALSNAWSKPLKIEYVPSKYGPTFRYTGTDAVIVVNAEGKVVTGWAKSSSGVGK